MSQSRVLLSITFMALTAACSKEKAPAASETPAQTAGVVDSALPADELLRRFRADIPAAPAALTGGTTNRDSLVAAVMHAIEKVDTLAIAKLGMNRAEFAYFYYPDNPQARPPYELPPDVMWLQMSSQSDQGKRRIFADYAGKPVKMVRYTCDTEPQVQGKNRIWRNCLVAHRATGKEITESFFASIIERDGQYKILSYANDR